MSITFDAFSLEDENDLARIVFDAIVFLNMMMMEE